MRPHARTQAAHTFPAEESRETHGSGKNAAQNPITEAQNLELIDQTKVPHNQTDHQSIELTHTYTLDRPQRKQNEGVKKKITRAKP